MFFTCLLVWKLSIFNRQKQPSEVFYKKGVLENFAKFTGKHLSQSLFSKEVAVLRRATLLKERLWHRCFSVNFAKLLRTTLFWIICCQPRKKKFKKKDVPKNFKNFNGKHLCRSLFLIKLEGSHQTRLSECFVSV